MKVGIVGAGAIGTLLANGIVGAGHEVAVFDLPARVQQVIADGLVVVAPDGAECRAYPALASTDPGAAEVQDVVFLATKAQQLPRVTPGLGALLGPDSAVVTIQNGIPWWYFQGTTGPLADKRLQSLDPDGILERAIDTRRIVGCVAYPAAAMDAAGRVRCIEGDHFPVGELDGLERQRTRSIAALLVGAGFRSRILEDIRAEIWLKAWGALSINPISVLTGATMAEICTDPGTRSLVVGMMREAQMIAEALGVRFRHTVERRIEGARQVGQHKTSMLQDLERGRELELDAVLGSVIEIGAALGMQTTAMSAVYACAALLDRQARQRVGAA